MDLTKTCPQKTPLLVNISALGAKRDPQKATLAIRMEVASTKFQRMDLLRESHGPEYPKLVKVTLDPETLMMREVAVDGADRIMVLADAKSEAETEKTAVLEVVVKVKVPYPLLLTVPVAALAAYAVDAEVKAENPDPLT